MDLKLAFFVGLMFAYASAASLKSGDVAGPGQYYTGMTSMMMMTEDGDVIEASLTDRSGEELPGEFVEKNTKYFLYTPEETDMYRLYKSDLENLQGSTFNVTRPTKVVIHGYFSTYKSEIEQSIKNAYLSAQNVNVICVDWSAMAIPDYAGAVNSVPRVGQDIGEMIDFLVSAGADVSQFHILGHSLGAHVSGFAANHVTSGNITRITGMDPALPLFAERPPSTRLDPTDASVVDCIHSCGMYLGWYHPLCTHDFYPNGGVPIQPGCGIDWYGSCSHGRSYKFYASSITNPFPAQSCNSFEEVQLRNCTGATTGYMGEPADQSAPGIYYLNTAAKYPFAEE